MSCTLSVSKGSFVGAAGTFYQVVILTNIGTSPCEMEGYPGVALVTGTSPEDQVGAPADRIPMAASLVTLPPGGDASFLLRIRDAGAYSPSDCGQEITSDIQVYTPGQATPLYLPARETACSDSSTHILAVGVVKAGTNG